MSDTIASFLQYLLLAMAIALGLGLIGLALMYRSIRRLQVPEDADYFTTLRYIPLPLAVVLDLLDFGLDILAAPVAWVVLDRLRLRGLRNKAAVEALIPFTQAIPTFTLSWVLARTLDLGTPPGRRTLRPRQPRVIIDQ